MLDLNEVIDCLSAAESVHWHSYVLRKENGHVLIRTLVFELKGWRKKEKVKNGGNSKWDVDKEWHEEGR